SHVRADGHRGAGKRQSQGRRSVAGGRYLDESRGRRGGRGGRDGQCDIEVGGRRETDSRVAAQRSKRCILDKPHGRCDPDRIVAGRFKGCGGVDHLFRQRLAPEHAEVHLDGGDNEDNLQNVNMPFPFPDAVAEFSVETSNAGAEIGKSSAGAVNVVTKSGTNTFHGNGFWFIRNTDLNASSYFLHQSDALKRNQAGGTIGGPVKRNRLFFFGGYQQTWYR